MVGQHRGGVNASFADWLRALPSALIGLGVGLAFGLLLGLRGSAPYLTIPALAVVIGGGIWLVTRGWPTEQKWPVSILSGLACLLVMVFWNEGAPFFATLAGFALAGWPALRVYATLRSAEKSIKRTAAALLVLAGLAGGALSLVACLRADVLAAVLTLGAAGLLYGLLEGMWTSAGQRSLAASEIENALYAGTTLALGAAWFGILALNGAGGLGLTGSAGSRLLGPSPAFRDLHFTSTREGSRQVYRQSAETGDVVRVTTPDKGACWMPRIGASGDLYVTCERGSGRQIFRQDPASGEFTQMTSPDNGECWGPALGPSGNTFFTCYREGKLAVYFQERSTGSVRRMTDPALGESWDPALGPSGELYFTSNRGGSIQVYRIPLDGGSAVRVTNPGKGACWSPALGPNGDLYMTCDRGEGWQIYRISHETGVVDRMTQPENGENWGPVLGPNENIHFTSNRGGKREVYRIDAFTGEVNRVTNTTSGESWTLDEK